MKNYLLFCFKKNKVILSPRPIYNSSDINIISNENNNNSETFNLNIETKKYKRKKNIPATIKRLTWNKYIGEEIGKAKCTCCNVTDITQMSFHCGHVISEKNGGDITVENLRPICQNCNSSMGTKNLEEFKNTLS